MGLAKMSACFLFKGRKSIRPFAKILWRILGWMNGCEELVEVGSVIDMEVWELSLDWYLILWRWVRGWAYI